MIDGADIRKLALALPGVEEKDHFGSPSFRFGGRIFIQINDKKREAIFKLSPLHQEILFEERPDAFRAEVWGNIRWTRVMLKHVSPAEIRPLIQEAYDQVAAAKAKKKEKK
ncbi:MAG TPA: MmcQ/YjbR family DNA-binding protein [Rhizomicrobium sp.]